MAFNMNPATTQVKYPFNGHLSPNEVFGSIFNMFINQYVKYPELSDSYGFVEKFRTEGSMYGDTILFYDQDVLSTRPWLGDQEAQNLLATERPDDPECQAVTLDQFRICKTTIDSYLSKRAWSTPTAFTDFNSILLSMVGQSKKLYEITLVNTYLGGVKGEAEGSDYEIPLSDIEATGEEKNRLRAQTIAEYIANLIVDLKDFTRKYNDYGFMRAYNESDLMLVWNSKYVNEINKLDLPTIFNKAGLMDKFAEHVLPARYFHDAATAETPGITVVGNTVTVTENNKVIALDEINYTTSDGKKKSIYAGEFIPAGINATSPITLDKVGVPDEDVICKVITKDTIKYMSAFEAAGEFYNMQALLSNHVLVFGFSKPERLKGQPCITVHED